MMAIRSSVDGDFSETKSTENIIKTKLVNISGGSLFVPTFFYGHRSDKFVTNTSSFEKVRMFGMKSAEDRNCKHRMFGAKVGQMFGTA
jgi:hypothetical protein